MAWSSLLSSVQPLSSSRFPVSYRFSALLLDSPTAMISKMLFDLGCLETDSLLPILNKLSAKQFVQFRKTCKAMNSFADRFESHIGVITDTRINIGRQKSVEVSWNRSFTRLTLREARRKFSGFCLAHISFDLDPSELKSEELKDLLEFLGDRKWRNSYLTMDSMRLDVLEIIRPRWLFTTILISELEDGKYREWFEQITAVPQVERLVFGIQDYRGLKVFELVLGKWCTNSLGNLSYVVPGINFTFCNVEKWETEEMLIVIKQRHMKNILEAIDKLSEVVSSRSVELHAENYMPLERYTENVELSYKPIGIMRFQLEKDEKRGCLVVEVVQYGDKDFNVSFCFYTNLSAIEEYDRRMHEFLSSP